MTKTFFSSRDRGSAGAVSLRVCHGRQRQPPVSELRTWTKGRHHRFRALIAQKLKARRNAFEHVIETFLFYLSALSVKRCRPQHKVMFQLHLDGM
jgi:hypothetical protein